MSTENNKYFKQFESIEQIEIMPGFKGRFIHTQHMTFVLWEIKKDSVLPHHHHPHEQVTQLLSGDFKLKVDGIEQNAIPNELVTIPSNVPHSGFAVSDCVIFDIFSPVREDYKKLL